MATSIVRRLYMYAAAFLGLQMLAAGLRQILRALLATVLVRDLLSRPDLDIQQLSYSVALALIGLVLWSLHWRWAQRGLAQPDEQQSALRRLYGYLVLLVAAISLLFNLRSLLTTLLPPYPAEIGLPLGPALAGLAVNGLIGLYHWRVLRADRQAVEQRGATATLRRWYLVLISAFSLGLASYAAVTLIQLLLRNLLIPAFGTLNGLDQTLAGLISGLLLWLAHELWARRLLHDPTPVQADETRSTLRQVYAALVITIAAVALLGGLTTVLYNLLTQVLRGDTWAEQRSSLIDALAVMFVAAPLWLYHRGQIAQQAQLSSVEARVETARRVVRYLMAAIGLAGLFFGLGGLLSVLLRLTLPPSLGVGDWQEQLSFYLALSIVALPVYGGTLVALERVVRGAAEEQRTLARRIYLYGALLFGIVTLIVAGVRLFQLALSGLLGAPEPGLTVELARWLGYALIGAAITWYHVALLRRAGAARGDAGQGQTIVLLADASLRERLHETLARELPAAQVHTLAPEQWPTLPELLPGAQVLIAPLALALNGPQAATINGFQGRRLLLAGPIAGAELVGAQQSEAALARELARALRATASTAPSAPPATSALPQGA